jgi:hypothetical protein
MRPLKLKMDKQPRSGDAPLQLAARRSPSPSIRETASPRLLINLVISGLPGTRQEYRFRSRICADGNCHPPFGREYAAPSLSAKNVTGNSENLTKFMRRLIQVPHSEITWPERGRNLLNRCRALKDTNERDSTLCEFSVKGFFARGKPESPILL